MVKQTIFLIKEILATSILFFIFFIGIQNKTYSSNIILNDTIGFNSYQGKIVESKSKKPLEFASLSVNGTNISTVSNTRGEFILKVPKKYSRNNVTVSFLGYTSKVINLSDFHKEGLVIVLETYIEELLEVKITAKDAATLVQKMLNRKAQNYSSDYVNMTAFYRETIKKRRTYVSLSEAIVLIKKQPYTKYRSDILQLHKSRKSTDYKKLDTIALKLKGGPFNAIHLDIMKNPEMLLTNEIFKNYSFSFDTSTKIDNRLIYVVKFKSKQNIDRVMFYGKLFIDAQSLALTSAQFQLNLANKREAAKFFIVKKPARASVTPIEAKYYVDYREKDGKWFYSYSRIQLGFKVKWSKKWFNSIYHSTIEMAITDWEKVDKRESIKWRDRLKPSTIISDEASGFSDPEFWGEFNLIEPEKSIETAIKKIKRQLKKMKK